MFIHNYRSQIDGGKKAKKPPVIFDLNTDKGVHGFRQAVQAADEEGDSPFDRIEVCWPLPMLEVSYRPNIIFATDRWPLSQRRKQLVSINT